MVQVTGTRRFSIPVSRYARQLVSRYLLYYRDGLT
jgi:hypothetical protein